MRVSTPHKVHIIGGSGSGKTTLARTIALYLKAPCYDLDEVGYEGGAGAQRPLETRIDEIKLIANQPSWVTEGVFLGWTEELLQKADVIIWLDLPWKIARRRIILRHVKAELRRNNRHPGWKNLYRFLQFSSKYYKDANPFDEVKVVGDIAEKRSITAFYLNEYFHKVIQCKLPSQVNNFLNSLKES